MQTAEQVKILKDEKMKDPDDIDVLKKLRKAQTSVSSFILSLCLSLNDVRIFEVSVTHFTIGAKRVHQLSN